MDVAGLVSSIITFIDFSWTIVRGTYDVHSSTTGATEENVHIGNVLHDLQVVTEKMREEIHGQNDHEKALLELEYMCRGLSSDLAAILQKLTAKRRSGLQSLNIMLRSLIKEKEVREIETRLGEYRGQMILRLNLILLEKSVAIQNGLQLTQDSESTRLRDLKQEATALTGDNSVLRHLYFDGMYKRVDSITNATYGTFDWLLTDENASSNTNEPTQNSRDVYYIPSKEWYEEQHAERRQKTAVKISEFLEHRSGVFFLRGKPGSGKSTLMKYLTWGRGKAEVDRKLRKWAGQKKLVRVSAMFLLHGTPLQRSLEGFYRTVFFELLCQCPDLTDILFPKRMNRMLPDDSYRSSFRLGILQEAWERFLSFKQHEKLRICVSIDGMDELEGDSGDRLNFARILNEWAQSEDIKIICSGRPNADFNIVFNEPHHTIDLQDLTRPDIRKIMIERFEEVRQFSDLTEDNIEELVDNISDQSKGVILWAVLVGKNIEDDIIHGKSFSAMERTIQTLPSGIEDLFNGMWEGLRHDAHQQLMLRVIYDLLLFSHKEYWRSFDPLNFSWLEDALFDDEFPYNKPIQVLPADDLNARLAKVRCQLVQYTKHFVEIIKLNPGEYTDNILNYRCGFIHRSAQEFIKSKLDSVGSIPAPDDYVFHLDLRLSLILQMSIEASRPTDHFSAFFARPFQYTNQWLSHRRGPVHQINYRLMEKLHELMEVRRASLIGESITEGSVDERWQQFELGRRFLEGRYNVFFIRKQAFSLFHLAVYSQQIDYVARILNDRTQQLDREDVCLGLLICVAGSSPNCELFEMLVNHGADPNYLVAMYCCEEDELPESIPLWLLFCFNLASKVSLMGTDVSDDPLEIEVSSEFLVLERFLCMGYGANVKFLVAPFDRDIDTDENNFFGMELAQVVRLAKPHNMSRLLFLLQPVSVTCYSLVQRLANCVLQPQFPFRALPQGAVAIPYRTVSDEYLSQERWEVRAAFEGEHEARVGDLYYIPGL